MTLRIREREWKEFHHDLSKIPSYLLKYIKNHDGEDMTLQSADLLYREGKQFVIEEITKEGAIFLLTCEAQPDIAFPVTGFHLVAFSGGRYVIRGQVVQHTQYAVEMPNNYIKNILYPMYPRPPQQHSDHKKTIGEMVTYSDDRKQATCFSFQVFAFFFNRFKFEMA